ncbi:MAG: hypothetical protein EP344_08420 [Bacteroidetes bacterium]|nr:MAG: hypothetical protein EP344_08420 [Bacteroidota bacterium]
MKIRIAPEVTIKEIQERFNAHFPYLKLVFFTKPHRAFKGSPAKFMIQDTDKNLGTVLPGMTETVLDIEPDMPTFHVESVFEEAGVYAQVFRKSGDLWLETSVTDKLTLEKQNAKGKASEHVHFEEAAEPRDYREQE